MTCHARLFAGYERLSDVVLKRPPTCCLALLRHHTDYVVDGVGDVEVAVWPDGDGGGDV